MAITPEIGTLKAFHGFLEVLTDDGAVPAKSTFVLNHIFARDMLSMKQIESAIAARVDAELPYDAAIYLKAVNEGVPAVRGARSSAAAKALLQLAMDVAGLDDRASDLTRLSARRARRPPAPRLTAGSDLQSDGFRLGWVTRIGPPSAAAGRGLRECPHAEDHEGRWGYRKRGAGAGLRSRHAQHPQPPLPRRQPVDERVRCRTRDGPGRALGG